MRTPASFSRRNLIKGLLAAPFLGASARGAEAPKLVDPARGPGAGWTIAVFPDTQNYAKYAKNQAHFELMTKWVKEHRQAWNIGLVMHEGDFVEQNNIAVGGGGGYGDQNSESQWASAKRALRVFDGVIPTVFTTGNHDYGVRNAEDRTTQFNDHFPLTHNPLTCDGQGGGIFLEGPPTRDGKVTLENAAYVVKVPGGRDLLIVTLEGVQGASPSSGRAKSSPGLVSATTSVSCSFMITFYPAISAMDRTATASAQVILIGIRPDWPAIPMTAKTSGTPSCVRRPTCAWCSTDTRWVPTSGIGRMTMTQARRSTRCFSTRRASAAVPITAVTAETAGCVC